jgi:hypothetical protein
MHSKCDFADDGFASGPSTEPFRLGSDDGLPPFPGPDSLRGLFFRLIGMRPGGPRARSPSLLSWGPQPTWEARLVQVVLGELTVSAEREANNLLRVLLTGKSASRDAGRELQPVFERLLSTAREEGRTLVLHFERLEYFNSSTIAGLVQFIRTAQQGGVGLIVRYDSNLKWQAMSFDALRRALKPFESSDGPTLRFDGGNT